MQSLMAAHPEWADPDTFEQARARMIIFGVSIGLSHDELFAIDDADTILSLWRAAVAMENDLWE
jgi:hypothetical protein